MCAAENSMSTSTSATSSAVESTPPDTAATIGPRMPCSAKKLRMASTITAIAYFVAQAGGEAVAHGFEPRDRNAGVPAGWIGCVLAAEWGACTGVALPSDI